MSKLAVEVTDLRQVTFPGTLAFFSLNVGIVQPDTSFVPLFQIRDLALKPSKDADGSSWITYPSKPRMKQGEQVMIDGKAKYDDIMVPIFTQTDDGNAVSEASKKFKAHVTGLAQAAYAASAPPAPAAVAAPRARTAPRNGAAATTPAPAQRARAQAKPSLGFDDFADFPGAIENPDDDMPF